jgi:hypothetical protein
MITRCRAPGSHFLIQQLYDAPAQPPRSASRSRAMDGIADIVRRADEAGRPAGPCVACHARRPPVSAAVADDHDLLGAKSKIASVFL